ncbi:MAG: LuxR C-terminal-related transcriptional regulator [Anaerolineales bacterium]|nr:LuxR C-terminal-related transcriptional regulator [Anaerolineales bacterium]
MNNTAPLPGTFKFRQPPVTRTLVERQRLLERLNSGLDGPLTLVCAPPGFGKTTLVSSWVDNLRGGPQGADPIPTGWLTLDEKDSEPVVFLTYLIGALRTRFPGCCPATLSLLGGPQLPPLDEMIASLCDEIEQLPGRCILVLDEYHTIRGAAVHNALNSILDRWPARLHLVIISRINPPLNLSRLRANDLLTEVRSRELRFNREEIREFFGRSIQAPLPGPVLDEMEVKTEGWGAALRLAALNFRSEADLGSFLVVLDRSREMLTDYLVDEILSRQFPAVRTFLLTTSILDRFSVPLCEAVLQEQDPAWSARACIDWLEKQELFVFSLDDRQEWYRYHRLFRDLLQSRLVEVLAPEQMEALHRRAALWFIQNDQVDQALNHALLTRDMRLVSSIMEVGLREALNGEDLPSMRRWLAMLPEDAIRSHPWLLMLSVWTMHFSWQFNLIPKYLDRVELLIDRDPEKQNGNPGAQLLRGQIATLRGQDAYFHDRIAEAKTFFQDALEVIPPDWRYLRGGLMFYLGLSLQAGGEGAAAEEMLHRLYEGYEDKADGYALRLLWSLCINYFNEGLLEKSRQTADLMLRQASRGDQVNMQGWARLYLGTIHYLWNDLAAAEEHFTWIIDNRIRVHRLVLQNGAYGQALVHLANGKTTEGLQVLQVTSTMEVESVGYEEDTTKSMRARLELAGGDLGRAIRWADTYEAPVRDQSLGFEVPHLTRARILLARSRPADIQMALASLAEVSERAEQMHNVRYQVVVGTLRALALDCQGKAVEAEDELDRAIQLAEPGGFLRSFIDGGAPIEALLGRMAGENPSDRWVTEILAAFPDSASVRETNGAQPKPLQRFSPEVSTLIEPLTPRELQILAYMREPQSFKEIANDVGIAHSTVKRHSINIYRKLGVNSRWEAVASATELGVIPARKPL